MTLQEAHEIQRKELISLRAENKRLQKQASALFPFEEKEALERHMDGYNLQKRMRDFQKDHLFFLSHPEVDYTNNISERELRKFKRKQKQAVVLRSDSGGQHICDALTIIETARMQNMNVYEVVSKSFRK